MTTDVNGVENLE